MRRHATQAAVTGWKSLRQTPAVDEAARDPLIPEAAGECAPRPTHAAPGERLRGALGQRGVHGCSPEEQAGRTRQAVLYACQFEISTPTASRALARRGPDRPEGHLQRGALAPRAAVHGRARERHARRLRGGLPALRRGRFQVDRPRADRLLLRREPTARRRSGGATTSPAAVAGRCSPQHSPRRWLRPRRCSATLAAGWRWRGSVATSRPPRMPARAAVPPPMPPPIVSFAAAALLSSVGGLLQAAAWFDGELRRLASHALLESNTVPSLGWRRSRPSMTPPRALPTEGCRRP